MNFTESQIAQMEHALKYMFGVGDGLDESEHRELAELQLEDLERKGCTLENLDECHGCSATADGSECPLCDWEKRHPEYKDDELERKIKALEDKSERVIAAKMRAQTTEEFKKLKTKLDLSEAVKALEVAARDMIEAAKGFEQMEGQSDEVQLKALAKVNEAFNRIYHTKLGYFLNKTSWFA